MTYYFFVYLPTGLSGRPICMVQDDWNVTTSLFPHPLLKSHTVRDATRVPLSFPLMPNLCGPSNNKCKSSTFVKYSISPLNSLSELWSEVDFPLFKFHSGVFRSLERGAEGARCKSPLGCSGAKRGTVFATK